MSTLESDGISGVYASDRTGPPDLRLIHYNDVYHVEYDSFTDHLNYPLLTALLQSWVC